MIDLRSDTVSKPTDAMRDAMARAEVGDDLFGDDPTVRELEEATAELLGKEAAVYVPTGTMANQIAVRLHVGAGGSLAAEPLSHVLSVEAASTAGINGVTTSPIASERGIFTADAARAALAKPHRFFPQHVGARPGLLWAENTNNFGGGSVWPVAQLAEIPAVAAEYGVPSHLDGARLWHAAIASDTTEAALAAGFDTANVCFSKALGAPVGSAMVGTAALVAEARRFKNHFGGGFRQAGIIAAGALHALREHRPQLQRTHELAARFAAGIADIPGIDLDPALVETNIVRFETPGRTSGEVCEKLYDAGLFVLPLGPGAIRAVFYLGVSEADVDAAIAIIASTLTT